jgi:gluconate 2-dehydrogenase gamma chain
VATGFYTTDAGMRDVGYVGNVALPKWELPPIEVRRKLGLE